ncbi:hypothetical protein CesoFtcFv8_025187 [Champsocephalus esox]|uniref:receptor protein-tyrosine kinase n=1 Tax=Champsocephalus esox TaxID=159716 RepID=A0AAN8B3C9_9TELE|nr:hypothetical protein CesoFtcFv8_025187 [Champsocephalus esox]
MEEMRKDSMMEEVMKDSMTEEVRMDSMMEEVRKDSMTEEVRMDSMMEEVRKDSMTEEVRMDSMMEEVRKDSMMEEVRMDSMMEEVRKDSMMEEVRKDSMTEEVRMDSMVEEVRMDSMTEEVRKDSMMEEVRMDSMTEEACSEFSDEGTCKDICPPLKLYNPKTHQLVNNPNAKFTFGASCVTACPRNYVVTEGSCVRTCSAGMFEVEEEGVQRCKPCDGPCPKACDGIGVGALINTIAVNVSNIESFRNCTKINGDVFIINQSLTGDLHDKIPPMDPAKLEYFRSVKEITGFLVIQSWPENWTSLSVFENLEIIRGRTQQRKYSVAVVKAEHLLWLGLRSLKEVSAGGVLLLNNSQLCFTRTDQWTRLFRSNQQIVSLPGNAPPSLCEQQNRTCDPECSEEGCWGPGPEMCVSCRHLTRRGRCVRSCHLLQGTPREVQVSSSCEPCHPECQIQSGKPSCSGTGPDQCTQCSHSQDGPHCVPMCPSGVLGDGDTLIWTFSDKRGRCRACSEDCSQGYGRSLAALWPLSGCSPAALWLLSSRSLAALRPLSGLSLAALWLLSGRSLAALWPLSGCSLWLLSGRSLACSPAALRTLSGRSPGRSPAALRLLSGPVLWPLSGRSLDALWPLSGCSLDALWLLSGRSLDALWMLSDLSLAALWPLSCCSLDAL